MSQQRVQDITCQQILQDDSRWIGVADKVHQDWVRCLSEIQVLEEALEKDEIRRYKYARWLRFSGFLATGFVGAVASASALLPFANFDVPTYVTKGLAVTTAVTFVINALINLSKKSQIYLTEGEDSKRLKLMCRNIRKNLRDIMKDGKITNQERNLIRDMMGQMHRRSEDIGSMNLFMNILGGNSDKKSQIKLFGSNTNYQEAYDGVSEIIQEIGRSHQEIKAKAPHIVREFEDAQLQVQVHSSANSKDIQRDEIVPQTSRIIDI